MLGPLQTQGILEVPREINSIEQATNRAITINYFDKCPMGEVLARLSSGPVDVYCWYESPKKGIPISGALFNESFFKCLLETNNEAKIYPYSLYGWYERSLKRMRDSTLLGQEIDRIGRGAIKCVYSTEFFKWCAKFQGDSSLKNFITREFRQDSRSKSPKKWLFDLSIEMIEQKIASPNPLPIKELFMNKPSLFDCFRDKTFGEAYSAMQYVEGYYLIRRSVEKAIEEGRREIKIAFVFPNDEGKYYLNSFSDDIEAMLRADFDDKLNAIKIDIGFSFFEYLDGSPKCRPYRPYRPEEYEDSMIKEGKKILPFFDFLAGLNLPQAQFQNLNDEA